MLLARRTSEIRWRDNWICVEAPKPPSRPFGGAGPANQRAEEHGLFRKTFTVDAVPARARTHDRRLAVCALCP